MILIMGSQALRAAGIVIDRPRLDIDFIGDIESAAKMIKSFRYTRVEHSEDAKHIYAFPPEGKRGPILDAELAWEGTTAASLIELVKANPGALTVEKENSEIMHLRPEVILTLKISHKYKKNSRHFLKTMRDIQHLKSLGYKVPKLLSDWLKDRKRETYNYKHPKLEGGVTKTDFFKDDGIRYVYDHDSIHEHVKKLHQPAYRFFQPEGEQVGTSKEEFFAQSREVQLLAVLEESYVLSLERSIVPFDLFDDEEKCRQAFLMALSKVCTSITSGWFRKFAWDNYDAVLELYDIEYVYRFQAATLAGSVTLYTKPSY